MNHLREIVEQVNDKPVICLAFDEEDSIKLKSYFGREQFKQTLNKFTEEAMCFDIGDVDIIWEFKLIDEMFRLPYKNTYFEMTCEGELVGVIAREALDGNMFFEVAVKKGREWAFITAGAALRNDETGEIDVTSAIGSDDRDHLAIAAYAFSIGKFLSAMNCSNVKRVEHKHPEKLQKARAKRGKKPLFSYWTLELKQERTESDPLGGTHASPRLHLRRGHPRQYAPGKYTWVQPCVVGNKAAGMVHKDYLLAA